MPRSYIMKFSVTRTQREVIEAEARAKGYIFVAAYLRDVVIGKGNLVEAKILETNEYVKQLLEVLK